MTAGATGNAAPAKVAILGTASSGKTTLAAALARDYGTVWVPEYLREFVDTEQRVPVERDQIHIARTQRAREDAAAPQAHRFLFCDTTPLMTAVYSRHYFNGIDGELALLADDHQRDYAFTLVTAPDIPWQADGLQRESEQVSVTINTMLMEELAKRAIACLLVTGTLEERLAQARLHLASARL